MKTIREKANCHAIFFCSRLECFLPFICAFTFISLFSCLSGSVPVETTLPSEVPAPGERLRNEVPANELPPASGLAGEIRLLTEKGTPSSLQSSLELIRSRGLASTDFGRVMNVVNASLLKTIYPAVQVSLPLQDPPLTHAYSRILKEAEQGNYLSPRPASTDFLEHILPFLSLYPLLSERTLPPAAYLKALPDLEKAEKLNGESMLASFFIGIVYEYSGFQEEAAARYSRIWLESPECFPAALGLARLMEAQGREQEAIRFLSELEMSFPDNLQVKRQFALALYRSRDWPQAEAAVDEILRQNSRDGEFVLMKAHILVERGQLLQAQAPLDAYAAFNPGSNRLFLFLRARVQAELYHNRDMALNYLRSILRSAQAGQTGIADIEAALYAVPLLMESSRPENQREGRELLGRLMAVSRPTPEVVSLALGDAISRESWNEAQGFLARLLSERRSKEDLLAAYTVEKGQGNMAAALSYAREVYELDSTLEDGIIAYVSALIELDRIAEASRLIEGRIANLSGGVLRSRYYYLRSLTRSNENLIMNDLRSSLFEDPRNLDAIIALFEIYHRNNEERMAVYYLKQALALSPNHPGLKVFEAEYAGSL